MRPTPRNFRAPAQLACGLFLAGLLLAGLPALAQTPTVTAAVPAETEQATYDLVVTISGTNFGTDSQVAFYVTGTTNPGGVTVKNVRRRNPKTIEATIDVAPDAQTTLRFDVVVQSNGRTGKGTELFKVLVKQTGPDTTPPGEVTGLETVAVDFGGVDLRWIAPADDSYFSASGPVDRYALQVRTGGPFTEEIWAVVENGLDQGLIPGFVSSWPGPGQRVTYRFGSLVPGSEYWLAVKARDEAENWSGITQISFITPPWPAVDWTGGEPALDACPPGVQGGAVSADLEFDLGGNPAVKYPKGCGGAELLYLARRLGDSWTISEPLPFTGGDFALGPVDGTPTAFTGGEGGLRLYRLGSSGWESELVDRGPSGSVALAIGSAGPVVALKLARGSVFRVARRQGTGWEKRDIPLPKSQNTLYGQVDVATDAAGNPVVAYGEDRDGSPSAEVLKVAFWEAGGWRIERVDETEPYWNSSNLWIARDPHRDDFTAAWVSVPGGGAGAWGSRVRVCDRHGAVGWTCSSLPIPADQSPYPAGLAIDSDGTANLGLSLDITIVGLVTRARGAAEWSAPELVAWGTCGFSCTSLALDAAGRPAFAVSSGQQEPRLQKTYRFWSRP